MQCLLAASCKLFVQGLGLGVCVCSFVVLPFLLLCGYCALECMYVVVWLFHFSYCVVIVLKSVSSICVAFCLIQTPQYKNNGVLPSIAYILTLTFPRE